MGQRPMTPPRLAAAAIATLVAIAALQASPLPLGPISHALAKDGGEGGGESGSDDDDSGSGNGNSGHGSGGSGHGSGSGKGARGLDDRLGERSNGQQKRLLIGPHGERIEVDGRRIEVRYSDGYRERLEEDRFEMRDPNGRVVIRRKVTDADRARLDLLLR